MISIHVCREASKCYGLWTIFEYIPQMLFYVFKEDVRLQAHRVNGCDSGAQSKPLSH